MIYEGDDDLGRLERLLEVQAPLDWSRVGQETWGTVISEVRGRGLLSPIRAARDPKWRDEVERMFHDIRQSVWWQGDDRYHPSASETPVSRLQTYLERGEFVSP